MDEIRERILENIRRGALSGGRAGHASANIGKTIRTYKETKGLQALYYYYCYEFLYVARSGIRKGVLLCVRISASWTD